MSFLQNAANAFPLETSLAINSKKYGLLVVTLEFMARDVSKGNALAAFCKKLNIDLSEVIAFGDSSNDISMLNVVGHAVAMGFRQINIELFTKCS